MPNTYTTDRHPPSVWALDKKTGVFREVKRKTKLYGPSVSLKTAAGAIKLSVARTSQLCRTLELDSHLNGESRLITIKSLRRYVAGRLAQTEAETARWRGISGGLDAALASKKTSQKIKR